MRYSVIVAIDNSFPLTNNFIENLLRTNEMMDSEIVVVLDGCKDFQTIEYLQRISDKKGFIKVINNRLLFVTRLD